MSIETMGAVVILKSGGSEVVRYEEIDRPKPGKGEVLIAVHAASINPADLRSRTGFIDLPPKFRPSIMRPSIPGSDLSGIVVGLGENVTELAIGDEVYGLIKFPPFSPKTKGGGRTHAEYTVAPVTDLAPKPASLTHVQAAAAPMTALTAWQQIYELDLIKKGQTVMITGAAGGVGHFAVQLAKLKGARVIAVASGRHQEFLRSIGADEIIDYTKNDPLKWEHEVDAVFDTVGGAELNGFIPLIKHGGVMIPVNFAPLDMAKIAERDITVMGKQAYSSGKNLRALNEYFDAATLRVAIDSVYPLADARKAHKRGDAGHLQGKIVLETTHA